MSPPLLFAMKANTLLLWRPVLTLNCPFPRPLTNVPGVSLGEKLAPKEYCKMAPEPVVTIRLLSTGQKAMPPGKVPTGRLISGYGVVGPDGPLPPLPGYRRTYEGLEVSTSRSPGLICVRQGEPAG